jgi:hypothetical protein
MLSRSAGTHLGALRKIKKPPRGQPSAWGFRGLTPSLQPPHPPFGHPGSSRGGVQPA